MQSVTIELFEENPILSDAWSRKRFSIKNESLIDAFLNTDARNLLFSQLSSHRSSLDLLEPQHSEVKHWERRNWELSLDYYLWSSHEHRLDKGENFQTVIREVISSYVEHDGYPEPPLTCDPQQALTLPHPAELPTKTFGEILWKRASVPATPRRSLELSVLSAILWHGLSVVRSFRENDIKQDTLNAIKSFGCAFDVFLCLYNVIGMKPGIYIYDVSAHTLQLKKELQEEELRQLMFSCQIEQKAPLTASFCLLLAAHFPRYQWRYRHEGALKLLYLNSGQIINPLILLATGYDLKTHISPALRDSLVIDLFQLNPLDYQVVYAFSGG